MTPTPFLMFGSGHRLFQQFGRAFQANDQPLAAPKFHVVAIDQTLGLGNCLLIVAANHRLKTDKMPVVTNDIGSVWARPTHRRPAARAGKA